MVDINLEDLFKEIKNDNASTRTLNSKVLLIDGLNNYMRAFSVNPSMNDDGTHIGGIVGFINTIAVAIRTLNPTRCIIIFDGKGGSTRRRKVFPEYKAQRTGLRVRLNRTYDFQTHDEEETEADRQLRRVADYIDKLPIQIIIHDHIEADDVIAYMAKELLKEDVIVMSTDKDFLQLVDERIKVWNPTRKKLYDESGVREDYHFPPKNLIYFRILDGDKSDNIPGIKGLGLKTIQKHLPILLDEEKVSLDSIIEYADRQPGKNTAARLIMENKKQLRMNYKLMKFGEIEISGTTKSKIRELLNTPVGTINRYQLKRLFLEDKLYSAIPNIDSWLNLNFNKLNAFAITSQTKE
jgi:DNA polymerase-1